MSVKQRVTINLDEKEYQELIRLSEKLDVSLAWLGRRAFSDLLDKYCNDASDKILDSVKLREQI